MSAFVITQTHIPPGTLCPECGKLLDAASYIGGFEVPSEGMFSVCIQCGTLLRFNADLGLRRATGEELLELAIRQPELMPKLGIFKSLAKRPRHHA